MASLQYTTPNTTWAVPDIVQTTDMNSIGHNLKVNRAGGGENAIITVAYGASLDIDMTHNFFVIDTGTVGPITSIRYKNSSDERQNGNIITLWSAISGVYFATGSSAGGDYADLYCSGGTFNIAQYTTQQFFFIYGVWHPIY
jgi:hypothetical protein